MIKKATIHILGAILLNYILSIGISMVFYGAGMSYFSVLSLIPILFMVFLGLILGENLSFEKKSKTFCYIFSFLFFFGSSFFISLGFLIFNFWKESPTFEIETLEYIPILLSGMFSVGNVLAAILLGYLLSTFNQEKKFKIEEISSEVKPETLLSAENPFKKMVSSEENPLQSIKTEEKSPSTEIKIPFSLLFGAIMIELTLALLVFFFFNGILNAFSMHSIAKMSPYTGLGLVIMLIMAYLCHRFINLRGKTKAFCIWLGILLMFFSLHLAINISYMVYAPLHWFELDIFFILNLIFLIFGGLSTLVIGIWLGYQMSKLRQ